MSCGNVSKQSNDPRLGCPRCGVNGSMVVLFIPHRQRREFRAVNRDFASSLIQLNNTFYREHSASFSDMRFENFAAGGALAAKGVDGANPSADASCPFEFYGVDSCQDLAIDAHGHALRIPNLHFQELDVLDALMKLNPAETPDVLFDAPLADISVCFGFMHHVPSAVRDEARAELTPPFEGYDSAQFEAGDHLIGWQNDRHAYRYCHHFDDQQITDLVRGVRTFYKSGEVPVRELERFHADGRSGELNRYVILKRL